MRPEAQDQAAPLLDVLTAELRTVLTEARTLTALQALDLPQLDAALAQAGRRREQLANYLDRAINRLPDPVYQSAARDLFPLPYAGTGWPKLAARGRQAGDRFNISYDGFRRSSNGRPSRLDEVLRQVAGSLLAELETDADLPTGTPVAAEEVEAVVTAVIAAGGTSSEAGGQQRMIARHRRALLPIGGLVVVLLLTSVVWATTRQTKAPSRQRNSANSFLPPGCQLAVGALDASLSAEPDAAQLQSRLVATYRTAVKQVVTGCPTGPAYRWQSITVQELAQNGRGSGALLASPNNVDLYLNNAAWGSYRQIGGKTGDAAQTTAGLPVREVPYGDGHVEIELSAGVVLVAERVDAPYFWIPAVFVNWWRDHQAQVGLPTGNPLPTFRQDFQKGFVSVNPPQLAIPVLTAVDKPQEELPTLDTIRGHIVRQPDSTSWFIAADGSRQWIPDGDTWICLGGDAKKIGRDLPGYAVASLPFGGQARCFG